MRAGLLPRWAGGLLAAAAVSPPPPASLLPHPLDRMLAVPTGIALIWLGYTLWSERRGAAAERFAVAASPQLRGTSTE